MYLYWIKRNCHKDVLTEGYVGVTTNPDRRFHSHKNFKGCNPHLHSAVRKYKDLEFVILINTDKKTCLAIEKMFRPTPEIGWNVVAGGGIPPPKQKGCWNLDQRKAISERNKKLQAEGIIGMRGKHHSAETKEKIAAAQRGALNHMHGKTHSIEARQKISRSLRKAA